MQSEVIEFSVDYPCAIKKLPYPTDVTSLEWKRLHDFNELKMSLCSMILQEKFWSGVFQIHFYFRLDKHGVGEGLLRDPCTESALSMLNENFKIEIPRTSILFSDCSGLNKVLTFTYLSHERWIYDTLADPYYLWTLGVKYKKYILPEWRGY